MSNDFYSLLAIVEGRTPVGYGGKGRQLLERRAPELPFDEALSAKERLAQLGMSGMSVKQALKKMKERKDLAKSKRRWSVTAQPKDPHALKKAGREGMGIHKSPEAAALGQADPGAQRRKTIRGPGKPNPGAQAAMARARAARKKKKAANEETAPAELIAFIVGLDAEESAALFVLMERGVPLEEIFGEDRLDELLDPISLAALYGGYKLAKKAAPTVGKVAVTGAQLGGRAIAGTAKGALRVGKAVAKHYDPRERLARAQAKEKLKQLKAPKAPEPKPAADQPPKPAASDAPSKVGKLRAMVHGGAQKVKDVLRKKGVEAATKVVKARVQTRPKHTQRVQVRPRPIPDAKKALTRLKGPAPSPVQKPKAITLKGGKKLPTFPPKKAL